MGGSGTARTSSSALNQRGRSVEGGGVRGAAESSRPGVEAAQDDSGGERQDGA